VGGKYPDSWHYNHMMDPTSMSPNSIMPPYPWLLEDKIDVSTTVGKIKAMKRLGVPYPEGYENIAAKDMEKQAEEIAASLKKDGIQTLADREIVALIAYLQRIGKDIKAEPKELSKK
ncbi:MAG: cbb3-type cytochrome c oxidase subunit II, partial [Bacteroidia bacterium]